jgi:hypothetical protein
MGVIESFSVSTELQNAHSQEFKFFCVKLLLIFKTIITF